MSVEYKKWNIDHVYDVSEGYEEIDHFVVWTPDRLDMVAEEFATIEQAISLKGAGKSSDEMIEILNREPEIKMSKGGLAKILEM